MESLLFILPWEVRFVNAEDVQESNAFELIGGKRAVVRVVGVGGEQKIVIGARLARRDHECAQRTPSKESWTTSPGCISKIDVSRAAGPTAERSRVR